MRAALRDREVSLSFRSVTPEEVLEVLKKLKNSKSTGADFIDTFIIKLVAKDLLPAITHIINLSITTNEFPHQWKYAKVIPLLKKDNPLNPKNYRPVALLQDLGKNSVPAIDRIS